MVLHLGAEVPYPGAVEVLDLCQSGAGDDVAAVVELALLLWAVFHLGEGTWRRAVEERDPVVTPTHQSGNCIVQVLAPMLMLMFNQLIKDSQIISVATDDDCLAEDVTPPAELKSTWSLLF